MEIVINGMKIEAEPEKTILQVAAHCGIDIPSLCYHSDCNIGASCRVCVVECNRRIVPACSTKVAKGMNIVTNSEAAQRARKINLELLFAQHQEECDDCVWNNNCKMLDLAEIYGVKIARFEDRKSHFPRYLFGPIEFDSSKCIDCRNCIDVCRKQSIGYLELKEREDKTEVSLNKSEDNDCIYCGQCIIHCPAGAFESVGEFEDIEKPFNKEKKVVFQIAPAIRATIGEEFGLHLDGTRAIKKLVASLKEIGADYVFDVSVGADITTIEECKEFVERLEKNYLPMITSCCPSWIRFVEFYYPEFIPNITSVRSPQIILGGIVKEYISKKENIDMEDISVVSVMPCVSKKHEAKRKELEIKEGVLPVDSVLTTREVGRLIRNRKINFKEIEEEELDFAFGDPTATGVSFGTSGGVMQSAIYNISEKRLDFNEIKRGIKEAKIVIDGREIKLCVVHGLANAREVLEILKKDPYYYDYIEVMACPEGCIGGGGQSVPTDKNIRDKRRELLCNASSKREKVKAKESKEVEEVYEKILRTEKSIYKFCHTKYYKANKTLIRKSEQMNKDEK